MEQLEIHSRSYLVRWVNVKAEHTISWSIQPQGHKKAINFGIFKHPGAGSAPTPKLPSSTFELPPTPSIRPADASHENHGSKSTPSTVREKLKAIGLIPISWHGTCEPGRVSTGRYDVSKDEAGMYALVFDNTFAKQFSKNVTFVLLTYPTDSPPNQNHHMRHIQGPASTTSLREGSAPRRTPLQRDSSDSVAQVGAHQSRSANEGDEPTNQLSGQSESSNASNFFTGVLQKRRRKRHQGYARRFFSLDFTTSTLSYYHNRHTLALRGAIPLSLAAIGANATNRQISIDSGAEIWHLKAPHQKDFEAWKDALEHASASLAPDSPAMAVGLRRRRFSASRVNLEEEREWSRVESLLKRIEESRDAAMSIAKDTDPKYISSTGYKSTIEKADSVTKSIASSASGSPPEPGSNGGYFPETEHKPFWKRRQTTERTTPGMFKRSVSATPTLSAPGGTVPTPRSASFAPENSLRKSHLEDGIHDQSMSLLRDLDAIASDFAALISESKQRRIPGPPIVATASRHSIDSQGSQEFFDAPGEHDSQLLAIPDESDNEAGRSDASPDDEDASSSSASDTGDKVASNRGTASEDKSTSAFPPKAKSLIPLPTKRVNRRATIPAPTVQPPSLISFLRKNVGKDLTTMSMPVIANEPISLLQRAAEQLEYSTLLDTAAQASESSSSERLLYIAAFAISNLSLSRVKERAIRKPFNPMLGETFEFVREDRNFRFLAEKISHHPIRMACQAESELWTFTQSPMPSQKFWGKSAELVTEGHVRVVLHPTGDRFSWAPATCFLRNIIAGEKYVEPVGGMTITNESTGEYTTVTFKTKGMFSGRSEDIQVQLFDSYGDEQPLGLTGKWTSSLTITENGSPKANSSPLWTAAELPHDAGKRYGFTTFAAGLNEITPLENGKMAPTDSRLRPDQRKAEEGDYEAAEGMKVKLEEGQRKRRKAGEENGEGRVPRWFEKVEGVGGEVWRLKGGKEGYWEQRGGKWEGVEKVFDV